MKLILTENLCKPRGIVNGVNCRLVGLQGHCLRVRPEDGGEDILIWKTSGDDRVFYPVTRGYSAVVHTV